MSLRKLIKGFKFLLEGTQFLIQNKTLLKWAFIPFCIDLLLFMFVIYFGLSYVSTLTIQALSYIFTSTTGMWFNLFYYPLLLILGAGFLVLVTYIVILLSTVIAAPFNALLAEKTLVTMGVLPDKPFKFFEWLVLSVKMILISIVRAVILLILGVFIFVMSFIPGLNVISAYLAFLVIAFDHSDYAMESLELGLGKRFASFKKNFPEYSGMSAALALTSLLPGLTLLTLPSAVVGSSLLVGRSMTAKDQISDKKFTT